MITKTIVRGKMLCIVMTSGQLPLNGESILPATITTTIMKKKTKRWEAKTKQTNKQKTKTNKQRNGGFILSATITTTIMEDKTTEASWNLVRFPNQLAFGSFQVRRGPCLHEIMLDTENNWVCLCLLHCLQFAVAKTTFCYDGVFLRGHLVGSSYSMVYLPISFLTFFK